MSQIPANVAVANHRGPKAKRGTVAERILRHARESFAERGYAATTLQNIARAAGVNTKLVRYYFTSKEDLLAECLVVPEEFLTRVRLLSDMPLSERGPALVQTHLACWADPNMALILRTSLLIAAHEPRAMAKVRAVFVDSLVPAIAGGIPADELQVRGGLVASQLLGLAFARFIFAIDQTVAIADEEIVYMVGATIQHYLNGPLSVEDAGGAGSQDIKKGT
jgi:AcrR family transcriptional regulator